jgi:hypothetical protein
VLLLALTLVGLMSAVLLEREIRAVEAAVAGHERRLDQPPRSRT